MRWANLRVPSINARASGRKPRPAVPGAAARQCRAVRTTTRPGAAHGSDTPDRPGAGIENGALALALAALRLVVVAALHRSRAEREDRDAAGMRERICVRRIDAAGGALRHARYAVAPAADRGELGSARARRFFARLRTFERPGEQLEHRRPVEGADELRPEIGRVAERDAARRVGVFEPIASVLVARERRRSAFARRLAGRRAASADHGDRGKNRSSPDSVQWRVSSAVSFGGFRCRCTILLCVVRRSKRKRCGRRSICTKCGLTLRALTPSIDTFHGLRARHNNRKEEIVMPCVDRASRYPFGRFAAFALVLGLVAGCGGNSAEAPEASASPSAASGTSAPATSAAPPARAAAPAAS